MHIDLIFFLWYGDHRDLHVLTHSFPTRRSSDLIEINRGRREARMAKQSLDLLKRIADQLAITFHGAHWCRCVGEAALDQHGKHVDCKGMPELMGAKPDRDAGVRAAAARPCEDRDRKSTRLNSSH